MEYYDIKADHQLYYCKCKCFFCKTKFKVKGEYTDLVESLGIDGGISRLQCPNCNRFRCSKLSKIRKLKPKKSTIV